MEWIGNTFAGGVVVADGEVLCYAYVSYIQSNLYSFLRLLLLVVLAGFVDEGGVRGDEPLE